MDAALTEPKPRYRVKARRELTVVQFPPRGPNLDVLGALDEFRGHVVEEAAVSIAMVAIGADGSCLSRYTWGEGESFFKLLGAVDRLAYRLHDENS